LEHSRLQLELREQRRPYALATVVEILGSSSAKPAAKALLDLSGKIISGWIGGGCAQSMVSEVALECFETGEPRMIEIDLNDEVFGAGMPCGGSMRVYVEPVLPKPLLWLMGHGRIVESLCEFACRLGFEVIVNDPQATTEDFPTATVSSVMIAAINNYSHSQATLLSSHSSQGGLRLPDSCPAI